MKDCSKWHPLWLVGCVLLLSGSSIACDSTKFQLPASSSLPPTIAASPSSQTLEICNSGNDRLDGSATNDADWLSLSPAFITVSTSINPSSTTVSPGDTFTPDVEVDWRGTPTTAPGAFGADALYLPTIGVGQVSRDTVTTSGNDPAATGTSDSVVEPTLLDETNNQETDSYTATQPPSAALVSIVPHTQEVAYGDSFSIDIKVDSVGTRITACNVTITFDADLVVSGITGANLMGVDGVDALYIPTIGVGEVSYGCARIDCPIAVNGNLVTIDFDVSPGAGGNYDLMLKSTLLDIARLPVEVVDSGAQVNIEIPVRKGDFDADGDIDFFDFYRFAKAYNSVLGDPNYDARGDFDDSGYIDFNDFVDFAKVYNTFC